MTTKQNKNLFGTTVSVSNESLVTCAHMEPYRNGPTYGVGSNSITPFSSKVGKCYRAEVGSQSFQTYFEFDNAKEREVRTSLSKERKGCVWVDYRLGNKCDQWEFNLDGYTYSWVKDWNMVSIMGTHHVQTKKGVAFSAPFARWEGFSFDTYYTKTMSGSIVEYSLKSDRTPIFLVATGKWHKTIDEQTYRSDPHNMDQTGTSFTKGTFYKFNKHFEQFVVGSPKAKNLQGRAYICFDCFGTRSHKNERELEPTNPQTGERFGAAVAAVDFDGDGLDDVIVGAPLHSKKVIYFLEE